MCERRIAYSAGPVSSYPHPEAPPIHQKKIRKLFSAEEDAQLSRIMFEQQFTTWIAVAAQIPGRTARQCRDRWANYLSPNNKNGPWMAAEDKMLIEKYKEFGPQWTTIAKFFDGRSENNVKNRWYTHLRNKFGNQVKNPAQPTSTQPQQPRAHSQLPVKPIKPNEGPMIDLQSIPQIAMPKPQRTRPLLPPISSLDNEENHLRTAYDPYGNLNPLRLKSQSAQPFTSYYNVQ